MRKAFVLIATCIALLAAGTPGALASNGTKEVRHSVQRGAELVAYGADWDISVSVWNIRSADGSDGYRLHIGMTEGGQTCEERINPIGDLPDGAHFHWSQRKATLTYPTDCGLLEVVWTAEAKWESDSNSMNEWYESTYWGHLEHRLTHKTVYTAAFDVFVDGQQQSAALGYEWSGIQRRTHTSIYKPLP
jgi:hypothetical protein